MEIGAIVQPVTLRDAVPSLPVAAEKIAPKPQTSDTDIAPVSAPSVPQAAASAKPQQPVRHLTNAYAVSDKRFTIYKDATGQYITRFTNLRDGKVTYVPDQDMAAFLESYRSHQSTGVNIEA